MADNRSIDTGRQQALGVIPDMSWVYQGLTSKPGIIESMVSPTSIIDITETAKNAGYGESRYDKYANTLSDIQDIENLRSVHQSSALKLLNGMGKMTTTAATTFVSNTLGSLYGLGKGLYNLVDGDEHTGFRDGLWNNSIVSAMQSIQDKMESVLPNYYSTAERENPWYSNIFTANFWGDKFLKNAGFTIGAMATMAVPGFKNFFGIGKGIANIGKAFANTTKGLQMAEKAGKIAMRVGNTLVSAAGEANIEAYNGAEAFMDTQENNINRAYNEAIQNINDEFDQNINNGMGYAQAKQIYDQKINNIENEKRDLLTQAKQHATDVGNSIFTLNMGILSASNNIQFGRLLSGGWKSSKHLLGKEGVKMLVDNAETKSAEAFGKGLAAGAAKFAGVEKSVGKNILLGTTENMLSEGSEELLQNLASGTSQAVHSAEMNQYMKQRTKDKDPYSLYGKSINPEVTDELVSWTKALGKVWKDEFGKASAGGWEEFVLGALTGGLGTVSVRKKDSGKVGLSWQGGFYEAFKDTQSENAENALKAEYLNKAINGQEFIDRTKHATAAMNIAESMNDAILNDDILAFKNYEMLSLVNDALFFRKLGLTDAYKSFYKEVANGLSDTDVENLKTLTTKTFEDAKDPNSKKIVQSYLDTLSSDAIKKLYTDKAKSNLSKIEKVLNIYDNAYVNHYENFLKTTNGNDALTEDMLKEYAAIDSIIVDLKRRRDKVVADKGEDSEEVEKIDEHIKSFRQKKKLIENDPQQWVENMVAQQLRALRIKNIQEAKDVKDLYYNANTIQEVAEIFAHSNSKNKVDILQKVIEEAPKNKKTLLNKFLKFSKQAKVLESAVIDALSNSELSDYFEDRFNNENEQSYSHIFRAYTGPILDSILQDISNREDVSEEPDLSDEIEDSWESVYENMYGETPTTEVRGIFNKIIENLKNEEYVLKQLETLKKAEKTKEKTKKEKEVKVTEEGGSEDNSEEEVEYQNKEDGTVEEVMNFEEEEESKDEEKEEVNNSEEETLDAKEKEDPASVRETPIQEKDHIDENHEKVTKEEKGAVTNTEAMYVKYNKNNEPYKNREIVQELENNKNVNLDNAINLALRDLVYKIGLDKLSNIEVRYVAFKDINPSRRQARARKNEYYPYLAVAAEVFKDTQIPYEDIAGSYIVDDEGKEWAIIGCINTNKSDFKPLQREINSYFNDDDNNSNVFISEFHTNIVVDTDFAKEGVNPGRMVYTDNVIDLSEIIENDSEIKVNTIQLENLHFATIRRGSKEGENTYDIDNKLGDVDTIDDHRIENASLKKLKSYYVDKERWGSVLLLLPGIDGKYHIAATLQKTSLKDIKEDSSLYNNIKDAIKDVYDFYYESRNVIQKKTNKGVFREALIRLGTLRDFFHINDERFFGYVDDNDGGLKVGSEIVQFSHNKETFTQNVLDLLKDNVNLEMNISSVNLADEDGRKKYLEAGMLRASINHLYFENAIFYVKPLGKDAVDKKSIVPHTKDKTNTKTQATVYTMNNKKYKKVTVTDGSYNEDTWTDIDGNPIDTEMQFALEDLEDAKKKDQYEKATKVNRKTKQQTQYIRIERSTEGGKYRIFRVDNNDTYTEITSEKELKTLNRFFEKQKNIDKEKQQEIENRLDASEKVEVAFDFSNTSEEDIKGGNDTQKKLDDNEEKNSNTSNKETPKSLSEGEPIVVKNTEEEEDEDTEDKNKENVDNKIKGWNNINFEENFYNALERTKVKDPDAVLDRMMKEPDLRNSIQEFINGNISYETLEESYDKCFNI